MTQGDWTADIREFLPEQNYPPWEEHVFNIKDSPSGTGLSAVGDQIIVLEDKYRSGYECVACDGEGYTSEDCSFCKGTGKESEGTLCRICCPRNLVDSGKYTPGKQICPACEGKGSLIVTPEISQRKPTSGVIVSAGPGVYPDCRVINRITGQRWEYPLRIGDRILYSQFAGSAIWLKQKELIRIMHAHEMMCKLYGKAKLGDWTR